MENEQTNYIYYLIDESGSMYSRKKTVIGGINEFLSEQKKNPQCLVNIYSFNKEFKIIYENKNINDVQYMNESEYNPEGTTALFDAMGKVINKINSNNGKHILIILTDGEENSSTEYDYKKIKELIVEKKNTNNQFEIIYIGSNQDAILNGEKFGATRESSLSYNDDNLPEAMRSATQAVSRYVSEQTQTIQFSELERAISVGNSAR